VFQTKLVEKIKTHIFSLSANPAAYEIMWKNIAERGRPDGTIWRISIACWTLKSTDTLNNMQYLLLFPLQQWSHERTSVLGYTYIDCLVTD
jgi:hypothetical protein